MSENSPKAVIVGPITPTSETAVCTQSVEVTEPTVEAKEEKLDMELHAATEENTPVKEVVEAICETTTTAITMEIEPAVPVVVPSKEVPVITKTVVLVAPLTEEPDELATSDVVEKASVGEEPIQVQEIEEEAVVESVESEISAVIDQATEEVEEIEEEGTVVETAASEISEAIDPASKETEEIKEEVQEASEIEAQSMVIAQAVIQDAMDKVSEDAPEPKKPATPTVTVPTPAQAVATIEQEIETIESPVVIDTPVLCEKPAPKSPQLFHVAQEVVETIQVEVTESLDAPVEEEEEKKPQEELKQAVEVKVSEETVVVEEVVEIKSESQTGEELEEVKEEEIKEDAEVQEPDVKETAEEVKPQSEEAKSEAPSEESKEKVLEIHMPVQVVLQTAQVIEEQTVEEEAVEEFDSNGPVAEDVKAKSPASKNKLSTLSEEPQVTASAEDSAPSQATDAAAASQPETEKTSSVKCAEVMAQVIEVIEEAVKEIEPVSTEITAAS